MDVPNTGTALIILVAFLLPGFVTVLLQERTYRAREDATDLDRLMRISLYSGWTYLVLALIALATGVNRHDIVNYYHDHKGDPAVLVCAGMLAVLVPAMIIAQVTRWWAGSWVRQKLFTMLDMNTRHTETTAWDFYMEEGRESFVRLTYANGSRVLGYYGGKSFAAYSRDGGDLYLEQVYSMTSDGNDWFDQPLANSEGIWVRPSEAITVEFYTPEHVEREAPSGAKPKLAKAWRPHSPRRKPEAEGGPASGSSTEEVADD